MSNTKYPQRTCINCRKKFHQQELLRLQCIDKNILMFTKTGRSFYLCIDCCGDINKVVKSLYKQCKNKADYKSSLKEIIEIWKTK